MFVPHTFRLVLVSLFFLVVAIASDIAQADEPQWIELAGGDGPGAGKHVVLVSGDEEYRSEEGLPALAKILAKRQGFKCTMLFAINPDGTINPDRRDNIPGLAALDNADLMVILTRMRNLPDKEMKHIVDYVEAGKPIVALRTATHAFENQDSKQYARYGRLSHEWEGGFGKQVLGETWVAHHGAHGKESTRGIIVPDAKDHPILRGIGDGEIWGPTDVYAVRLPLDDQCQTLVRGQVIAGMKPDDSPVKGAKNDPMMPIAWTRAYASPSGKSARVFTTTMGAADDLENESLRRLIVNACLWAVGREDQIPARTDVSLVGEYHPSRFGFGGFEKGKKPADYGIKNP